MMDIKINKLPEPVNPNFHPSPTMQVHFANGEVMPMNRKERRRHGLYGDRILTKKGRPASR